MCGRRALFCATDARQADGRGVMLMSTDSEDLYKLHDRDVPGPYVLASEDNLYFVGVRLLLKAAQECYRRDMTPQAERKLDGVHTILSCEVIDTLEITEALCVAGVVLEQLVMLVPNDEPTEPHTDPDGYML
jgi:hypothetical protein